jgi:hypothetical protein
VHTASRGNAAINLSEARISHPRIDKENRNKTSVIMYFG